MNASLAMDLRYQAARAVPRALYSVLFARRRELPYALEALTPEATAGAALGCSPAEAAEHLAALRAAGLVGDGLTLLAGIGRARLPVASNTDAGPIAATGTSDVLRTRAIASGRGASDLARAAGLGRSSVAHFLAGTKGLGAGARMLLTDALDGVAPVTTAPVTVTVTGHSTVVTAVTPVETQGIVVTAPVTPVTVPPAPLASLVPPSPPLALPSDSLPDPSEPPALPAREAHESPQEPAAKTTAPASQAPRSPSLFGTQETPTRAEKAAAKAAEREAKATARAEKAAAAEKLRAEKAAAKAALAASDPVPEAGTTAHRVYLAVTGDRVLAPITVGPGEFASRACDEGTYPGVDVLAEVRRAGEWLSGKPAGYRSDGRAFLRNWLRTKSDEVARAPKPAAVGARVQGSMADLTARVRAAKEERERAAALAAQEPQVAAGGSR